MFVYVKILLFVALLFCQLAYAGFPSDQPTAEGDFPQELRDIFSGIGQANEHKATILIDSLEKLWTSDLITGSRKDTVLQGVKLLREKRYSPWPYIGYYLRIVLATATSSDQTEMFSDWHEAFAWSLANQTFHRNLSFIERSVQFIENQVLFKSGSVEWKIHNGSWYFDFSDQQPKFVISDTRLSAHAHGDSSVIYNTHGKIYLVNEVWEGEGGKISWQRDFLDREEVYAKLDHYNIDLNIPGFQADSVQFFHHGFFSEPLLGRITERLLAEVKPGEGRFPRFESYQKVLVIEEIFPDINYKGGFTIAGARILGSGTVEEPARVDFFRNDSLFVSAFSAYFGIDSETITSEKAAVNIFLAGDSIFHPSLTLRYNHNQNELSMIRDLRGGSRAPFFNTYHKVEMYCEVISWKTNEPYVNLGMLRGINNEVEAMFESYNYFSPQRYHRLQGMDEVNPLVRLSMFSRQVDTRSFPIADFARYLRRDQGIVKHEILNLSFLGFLSYDIEREWVTLNDKLFHYILANAGNSDYDVVRIVSQAPVNAVLNTRNYDLRLYGVNQVTLSNAKNVIIYPEDSELVLQKNRDLYFNGQIESGLFNFYGKDFLFEYDDFRINLVNTDSMSFSVRSFEPDQRGRFDYVKVETVLEGINGELLVDHPINKSGRLPYARYPIFNSNNESFVFFDREKIQQGVYNREEIYFQIVPFTIDSLDHASTDNLAFDGVFYSGGIFPEFFDYLRVQPDFSLGFNTQTPEEGFPVYDGQAWYTGPIQMSYMGLSTSGNLKYLDADIDAYNMLMFPDSISGVAENFLITDSLSNLSFPQLEARMVDVLLLRQQDKMTVSSRNDPVQMYNKQADFRGQLVMDNDELIGSGETNLFDAIIVADYFSFSSSNFNTGESIMGILSGTTEHNSFSHFGYQAYFDMKDMVGNFYPVIDDADISFPSNNIVGPGFDYSWDIELGILELVSPGKNLFPKSDALSHKKWLDIDFSGYELVFTNSEKEGLSFYASDIQFDLSSNLLSAYGVNLVRVADAAIFPENQQLFVEEGSNVRSFENADIVANTITRFHHFYNADAEIFSRVQYEARAMYDFVDETGRVQPFEFHQIEVNFDTITVAQASLPVEHDFSLSPKFLFMGEVELNAADAFLTFDGYSRIFADCPGLDPQWFKFRSPIDPFNIYIPVNETLRGPHGEFLTMGILMAGDSLHIYSGIFSRRRHWSDVDIVSATGYITYDKVSGDYRTSSKEKLNNLNRAEDFIRFSTRECLVQGQGKVDLGSDLGQLSVTSFGTVTHDLQQKTIDYDLVLGLDFYFSDDALDFIRNSINANESLELLSMNRPKIISFLQREMGSPNASPFIGELTLANSFRRLPTPMVQTMFFGDVKLSWNQSLRSLISSGPLGLVHVNKNQVYRYIDGFIEIRKQRGGDVFSMILTPGSGTGEALEDDWYFFTYSRGVMQTLADQEDYNRGITDMRQRQRKMRVERGEEPFVFILSSQRRPFDFYDHMMRLVN